MFAQIGCLPSGMVPRCNPKAPDVLFYVASLDPPERLAIMDAMTTVFPQLRTDRAWKAESEALWRQFESREAEAIMVRSIAIAGRLRDELSAA